MKKLFLLIAVVAMALPSCKKIEASIDALENRIDKLEQEAIPTIDEQIAAINVSLENLDAMDKELKGYIDGLTATASSLQEQINATNTKIGEVKAALQNEISAAKAEVLAELEALETELKNELSQINATIETLKAKDEELDKKIADLRSYVDTELGKTTDWVNATFATLTQYNALVAEVTTIKAQIVAINKSIADLETRLTTKINEDIANAVATLNTTIQQKVKEITDAYTNAVKTAKEEVTAAYTAAIATAISNLETSMKSWVGEQLANYYTIAEVEAKITALQTTITEGDEALQKELSSLKSQLETTAAEITAAYKKAIEEAITTNNGVINAKIASEIAAVNKRIDEAVAAINAKIAAIESRLDNVEAKIAELLARIQTVSYIPTYSDGKATMKYADNISRLTLDFEISPKDAVAELAKVWQDALTIKAIYTETRAVEFIEMPITEFVADTDNGIITITASGENLSEDFFSGSQSASVGLSISDGNNSVTSEYITMMAKAVSSEELGIIPSNQIWYTSSDGNIVTPNNADAFGVNIISNTYDNSKGIIQFDGDVTFIGSEAFRDCSLLASISIPDSATTIEEYAFYCCPSLSAFHGKYASSDNRCLVIDGTMYSFAPGGITEYTIPRGITSIGASACEGCTNLINITISNDVASIGSYSFFKCSNLNKVIIGDSVARIENDSFKNCFCLQIMMIGKGITYIGPDAVKGCANLTSIYCEAVTPPILEYNALYGTHNDMIIYVPTESVELYKAATNWKTYASQIVGYDFE